jgi:hypothetical protein
VTHVTAPPTGTTPTTVNPALRFWAAWLLLAITGFMLLGWAMYWFLPFSVDTPRQLPVLMDGTGLWILAAPAFAAFLSTGLRPALPSAPAVEVIAVAAYAAAAASHTGYLVRLLAASVPDLGSGLGAALEEIGAVVLFLLFLGLVVVAGAYVVSLRRARTRSGASSRTAD